MTSDCTILNHQRDTPKSICSTQMCSRLDLTYKRAGKAQTDLLSICSKFRDRCKMLLKGL